MLLAQVMRGAAPAGGGPPPEVWGFLVCMIVFLVAILALSIVVQVYFCLNLSRLLKLIHRSNREIEPGQVWFIFIPLFNIVWIFLMTSRVSDAVANEYDDRRWRPDGDFGKQIGMWWGICTVASCVPYIGVFPGVASLVLYILYWVKMHGYRQRLERARDRDYEDRREDDYNLHDERE